MPEVPNDGPPPVPPGAVLVGVRGDGEVGGALRFAIAEARLRRTGLHLLHVVPPVPFGPDDVRDDLGRAGLALLERVAQQVRSELAPDLEVTSGLVHGQVAPSLVSAAAPAALVVLQHQRMGRPGLSGTLSVTNPVAALSGPPVVAVPADWGASERAAAITVGAAEGEGTPAVVAAALEVARIHGCGVRVLNAWHFRDPYDDMVFEGVAGEAHSAERRRILGERLAGVLADRGDVPVELVVVHDRAADALVREAERASLVIVGRHRHAVPLGPHLGSVVRAVLRHASCPVMVVDPVPPEAR